MKRSVIVTALAEIASKGRYTVDPAGAKHMNQVFDLTAELINELESEEKETENSSLAEGDDSE